VYYVCTYFPTLQVLKMMVGKNLNDNQLQQVGLKELI
jgi:hypothetical protein